MSRSVDLSPGRRELRAALFRWRGAFLGVALFSSAVNILMLTGPMFMLQVYDRVIASGSSATLLVLFSIVVFLYGLLGLLDHVRGRMLARIGAGFFEALSDRVFRAVLRQAEMPGYRNAPAIGLRDLSSVQSTLAAPNTGAVFDLPWTPLFVLILFLFHPWLGYFAIVGVLLVFGLALLNQWRTRAAQSEAARMSRMAETRSDTTRRSIETVVGLGMAAPLRANWQTAQDAAIAAAMKASDTGGALAATTKAIRLLLQSAILGLGAYLVLLDQLTPGAMIAGSILLGRALAPVEQTMGQWPAIQRASRAWTSLAELLSRIPLAKEKTALPNPKARLAVKDLAVVPPGGNAPTLQGVSFSAEPGDSIAVIGPSGSGKSSLARALVGLWPAARGEVRLDGAELSQYDRDRLGRYLGYLPQDAVLFPGTIAQNVARFDPDATANDVVAAARLAAAHDLILALPDGYDTELTDGSSRLSGGQRQRIGLARAFYDNPVLLVLDEPNANLDEEGAKALNHAIGQARDAGKITLVMSHRPAALQECNKVLFLDKGRMRGFGPRDEMLERFVRNRPAIVAAQTSDPTQSNGG